MGDDDKLLNYDESAFTDRVESEAFGPQVQKAFAHLTSRVIGQDRAARGIANGLALYYAGLNDPTKPIGTYLFSGPTGWGKTFMAEETARFLIGDVSKAPLIRIPCAKYSEQHRVSELIGSPPGYVDSDKVPGLAQLRIEQPHFDIKAAPHFAEAFAKKSKGKSAEEVWADLYEQYRPYLSVILFDEVEKAHHSLHDALLHIIDDGELALPHGNVTSFAHSIIILTCNVGGREQQEMISGRARLGFGRVSTDGEFTTAQSDALDDEIYRRTLEQIEKMFAPELIGRLKEDIVVFRTLSRAQQKTVLETMLVSLQRDLSGANDSRTVPLTLRFSEPFKEFLLNEGINRKYGLRPLKRAVRKLVRLPIGKAISAGDLREGDEVLFKVENGKTVIYRKKRPPTMLGPLGVSPKR